MYKGIKQTKSNYALTCKAFSTKHVYHVTWLENNAINNSRIFSDENIFIFKQEKYMCIHTRQYVTASQTVIYSTLHLKLINNLLKKILTKFGYITQCQSPVNNTLSPFIVTLKFLSNKKNRNISCFNWGKKRPICKSPLIYFTTLTGKQQTTVR